jgi:DNA polymerase III epsilon subunit-like protein
MLSKFSKVYEQADLAVAHNGIKFDVGTIRARLVKHGLKDIRPVVVDDTYIQSVSLGFNCHKLDYLANYLGLGQKAPHSYELWTKVMRNSHGALKEMVRYCIVDVLLLERVYRRLLPYIKTKVNRAVFHNDASMCPSCESTMVGKHKKKLCAGNVIKQQYQCKSCGKYFTLAKNLAEKPGRFLR